MLFFKKHNIYDHVFDSGDVVTLECVEKIIKKDMIHPLTGQKLMENDIVIMQRVSIFFLFCKNEACRLT